MSDPEPTWPIIHGAEAASSTCEACGEPITRLQVQPAINAEGEKDYAPAGPWYEGRQHQRGNATHHFWQKHNCIRPAPDTCPFCPPALPRIAPPAAAGLPG